MPKDKFLTIIDILKYRAKHAPTKLAYRFVVDDNKIEELSYSQLENNISQLAQALLKKINSRDKIRPRVLILCQPGLSFITSFFSCLLADIIPIPFYPPRHHFDVINLHAIIKNAEPSLILINKDAVERTQRLLQKENILQSIELFILKNNEINYHETFEFPEINPQLVAYLQYTSGSTGTPKGVMVSHQNIMANSAAICAAYGNREDSVMVAWLPPYHDMGLIGAIIQPLYVGCEVTLMSPFYFSQNPIRWLNVISKYKGTTSGANDFSYMHCIEKISHEEAVEKQLDLSNWTLAFSGAEMVHETTMEQFNQKFWYFGFQSNAWLACYGLAEATLMLSATQHGEAPLVREFDNKKLMQGTVEIKRGNNVESRRLVSSGRIIPRHKIIIVNPQTRKRCAIDEVGEIWAAGPSITLGYWNDSATTKEQFHASLVNDSQKYLRTGDLGFILENELYICGRIKELIIIRGKNYYAKDIESSIFNCHSAIIPNRVAAISIEENEKENLLIVSEIRGIKKSDYSAIIKAIKTTVVEKYGIQPYAILLIRAGTIPKTTSGKIKHPAIRENYYKDKLVILHRWSGAKVKNKILHSEKTKTDKLIDWSRDYANTRINSRLYDERRCIPPYIFMDVADAGLMGLQTPEKYGGLNLNFSDMSRVIEQWGAIDISLGVIIGYQNALGIRPLLKYGSQKNIEEIVPRLANGKDFCAFAVTEPAAGAQFNLAETTATPKNKGWVLNGIKRWNIAGWANFMHVFANVVDKQGVAKPTLFTIHRKLPGVSTGPEALTMGFRGILQSSLIMQDVYVDSDAIIGEVGKGAIIVDDILNISRFGIAILSLGAMKRCAQLIHRYASRRKIITGKLLDNPIILEKISRLNADIAVHQTLIESLNIFLDSGKVVPNEMFMAIKVSASEHASEAAGLLIQLLGGRGYMENNFAPQILRDVRAFQIIEGPSETLSIRIGRIFMQEQFLQQFLIENFNARDIVNKMDKMIQMVYEFNKKYSPSHAHALMHSHYQIGLIAIKAILAAACRANKKLSEYSRLSWNSTFHQLTAENPQPKILQNRNEIDEANHSYTNSIGNIEQSCPAEDLDPDPLLQLHLREVSTLKKQEKTRGSVAPLTADSLQNWIKQWLLSHYEIEANSINAETSLFSFGLDSIGVGQLTTDLEKFTQISIDPSIFWEYPLLHQVVDHIMQVIYEEGSVQTQTQIPQAPVDFNHLANRQREWLKSRNNKNFFANLVRVIHITGPLNIYILEKSLNHIIQKHEFLRSTYPELEHNAVMQINDYKFTLQTIDLPNLSELSSVIKKLVNTPLKLDRMPLFNIKLIKVSAKDYYLVLIFHHIIFDMFSFEIIFDELIHYYEIYLDNKGIKEKKVTQYRDYIYWNEQERKAGKKEGMLEFWVNELKDAPVLLNFPLDHPYPAKRGGQSKYHIVRISLEKSDAIRDYVKNHNVTAYTFLFTIFTVLLHLYSGDKDIIVGSLTAGRYHPDLKTIPGYFSGILPYRTQVLPELKFSDLLQSINKNGIARSRNTQIKFDEILEALNIKPHPEYNPYFQFNFGFTPYQLSAKIVEKTKFTPSLIGSRPTLTITDLYLALFDTDEGIVGAIAFNSEIFEPATIQQFAENYMSVIDQCLENSAIKINKIDIRQ